MSHSFSKIWIHAIWATKERQPFIASTIENTLHEFIRSELRELGCPVRIINGMPDHIHCLFLLSPQKSIADVIKQIKGSSAHLVNQQHLVPYQFSWQTGYSSYSVSESILPRVYEYIREQKTHHKSTTLEQEYKGFLKLHGLDAENPWG